MIKNYKYPSFRFHRRRGSSRIAEQPLGSKEGLCCMLLVAVLKIEVLRSRIFAIYYYFEKRLLASSRLSVRPHGTTHLPLDRFR